MRLSTKQLRSNAKKKGLNLTFKRSSREEPTVVVSDNVQHGNPRVGRFPDTLDTSLEERVAGGTLRSNDLV